MNNLEVDKNRDLATSATSKIFEKVNDALAKEYSDKRWFWELLQNAKDTVAQKTTKVDVIVKLTYKDGEPVVMFEHNGEPFKHSNHRFKFDDPKCLLLADSGKIEEDETQREDITGQFGTGFLSTHVLSMKILVEGIFLDAQDSYNKFNFLLDRVYKNKFDLAEKVETSLNQYDGSFARTEKPASDEFHTKFTYYLNQNKHGVDEGHEVFKNGIHGIEDFIPYVLCFSNDINSVKIINNIISNSTTLFSRDVELSKIDNQIQIVPIHKIVYDKHNSKVEDSSYTIYVAKCHKTAEQLDLAIEISKQSDGRFKVSPMNDELPILFCTFPLIGSQDWRYPTVLNCSRFHPRTERDGILLTTDKDDGNQNRIEQALMPFKSLVTYAINHGWDDLFWFAKTDYETCPKWATEDWYKESLRGIREFLVTQPIVVNEKLGNITMENALFPTAKKDDLELLWDICSQFIPNKIPLKKDVAIWGKIISSNYSTWGVKFKYDLEILLEDIEAEGNLDNLSNSRFEGNLESSIDWLNKMLDYILNVAEKSELLQKYAIIPNKKHEFHKIGDKEKKLHTDNNGRIPDKVIEIYKVLHTKDWAEFLIHPDIMELDIPEVTHYGIKSITRDINVGLANRDTAPQLKKMATNKIISYSSTFPDDDESYSQDWRENIWKFAKDLDNSIPAIEHIDGLPINFWEQADKWILAEMVLDVQRPLTLTKLTAKLGYETNHQTLEWLNSFIGFYVTNKKETSYSDKSIFPNQNGILRKKQEVHFDDNIPQEYKTILEKADALLGNTKEWSFKYLLLDKQISNFEKHQPLNTKKISIRINELIELLLNPEHNYLTTNPQIGAFKQLLYDLASLSSESKAEEKKELLRFAHNLYPSQVAGELKVLSHSDDFDFEQANEWMLNQMTDDVRKLGSVAKLDEFNEYFSSKKNEETVEWLDDFIFFVYHFEEEEHKAILEKKAIIPNQNNNFLALNDGIKRDKDIPEDLKEIANARHIRRNWNDFLAHKKLKRCNELLFDEDNTRTIKHIAEELDEAVRLYSVYPFEDEFSELLFMMNQSDSVNDEENLQYFSHFHNEKDRLIVGTLGEGKDLENVALILQDRKKLDIMADLSRTGISSVHLEEYKDAVEKVGAENIHLLIKKKKEEQEEENFHTHIGELAEEIFKVELETRGFNIIRTGHGSDFSIIKDTVEVYVEIKSCVQASHFVKMTSYQAKKAISSKHYILCVIPKDKVFPTENDFRNNSKFVTDISMSLKQSVSNAQSIRDYRDQLANGEISLLFEKYDYKHSIARSIWEFGVNLDRFIDYLLKLK